MCTASQIVNMFPFPTLFKQATETATVENGEFWVGTWTANNKMITCNTFRPKIEVGWTHSSISPDALTAVATWEQSTQTITLLVRPLSETSDTGEVTSLVPGGSEITFYLVVSSDMVESDTAVSF